VKIKNKSIVDRLNEWYDDIMYHEQISEYFGFSHFYNYGYWEDNIHDQKSACENLVEKLLSFIPIKEGNILDVACGMGASSRYLLKYYKPQDITGVNISEKQLETCRQIVPGATFLQMDATSLNFENQSFNNIICLEAVFHFHTRKKFLQEAYRVLKPSGTLVLSDVLLTDWGKNHGIWWHDKENTVLQDLKEYEELYKSVGFKDVQVIDATRKCWVGYYTNVARYCIEALDQKKVDLATFQNVALTIFRKIPSIRNYLLVGARKA
jgi:ubiquinone/menaquinone biosynthesis C-methylase UbiE